MSSSLDIPRPRAATTPLGQDSPTPRPASTTWRDTLSHAAETWAMFLGAAIPPSRRD